MDLDAENKRDSAGSNDHRWTKVRRFLDEALDLDPQERAAYLDRRCPDAEIRAEIEDYLAREVEVADFIERPVSRLLDKRAPERREGQRVGAYRLERQLGQGGMGVVYLARRDDEVYDQEVAVKVLKRGLDTDAIDRRFKRERQILARLDHPHVARIVDGGSTGDGLPYFVMEHVVGTPIDVYCRERDLGIEARLELFRKVCDAVHFAHQNLVVHCDLKPSNILVSAEGVPKLLDFGIARLLRSPQGEATLTRLPWRPGTPAYMSPEQARGQAITTASDVYSLGVLLHELLTDQRPGGQDGSGAPPAAPGERSLPRPSTAVRARAADDRDPEAARRRRQRIRRLRGDLDTIVAKAVHPEADRRYPSASALADDLRRHLAHEPISARPESFLYRAGRFVRRRPVEVAAGAAALAMVLFLVVLLAVQLDRTRGERDRAAALRDSFLELLETIDLTNGDVSSEVAVDVVEKALRRELSQDPAEQARFLDRMGMVYRRFGFPEEARRLLEEALRLLRSEEEVGPARLHVTLNNLGMVYLDLGRSEEAEALLEEALDVNPARDREERAGAVKTISNQAAALVEKGHLAAAELIYRRLLETKRELHGELSPEFATGLQTLAGVLIRRDKLDEAEPLVRRALALRKEVLGATHPNVASTLINLGLLLDARGRDREAAAAYREALEVRSKHFTPDHPDIARVHAALAFSLLGSGEPEKLAEAEALFRGALAVYLENRGEDHPHTLIIQRNLAATLLAQGKASAAEPLAREVVERSLDVLPPDHWRIADARSVLGHSLTLQGRYADAEKLVVEAYPVIRDVKGESSRYAEEARQRVAALYRGWGREDEARRFLESSSAERNLRSE